MRNPRLSPARAVSPLPAPPLAAPPLVVAAHGSKDPRAAATVSELLAVVRKLLGPGGPELRAAFLDHCAPSLPQALASLVPERPGGAPASGVPAFCVAVPLLLTAAYHSKADIPAQLAAAAARRPRLDVVCAAPLGPHPLLLAALERRLRDAGVPVDDPAARAATRVVLAAAGSADAAANASVAALAARWAVERGWQAVVPAYASAAGPRPGDAVTTLRQGAPGPVAVATYLLAPGYFAEKIRSAALASGAGPVAAPLGAAPEVAAVVVARYREALRARTAGNRTATSGAGLARAHG